MDRAIYHHLMIGAAFADVIALLRDDPQRVLQEATTAAAQHADTAIATLQVRVAEAVIERFLGDVATRVGAQLADNGLRGRLRRCSTRGWGGGPEGI